jgi:hypothetical protein
LVALIEALLAMRSRARVSASFYKAFERMRRALRINPGAVFFVYIKRRRRPRRDSGPTITPSDAKGPTSNVTLQPITSTKKRVAASRSGTVMPM